ncbi:7423_t:CDS:1, partial [Acaulospora morrowiae]
DKHLQRDAGLKIMNSVVNRFSSKTFLRYLDNFFTGNSNKNTSSCPVLRIL